VSKIAPRPKTPAVRRASLRRTLYASLLAFGVAAGPFVLPAHQALARDAQPVRPVFLTKLHKVSIGIEEINYQGRVYGKYEVFITAQVKNSSDKKIRITNDTFITNVSNGAGIFQPDQQVWQQRLSNGDYRYKLYLDIEPGASASIQFRYGVLDTEPWRPLVWTVRERWPAMAAPNAPYLQKAEAKIQAPAYVSPRPPAPPPLPTPLPEASLVAPPMRKVPNSLPGSEKFTDLGPWRVRVDAVAYGKSGASKLVPTGVYLTVQNKVAGALELRKEWITARLADASYSSLSPSKPADAITQAGSVSREVAVRSGDSVEVDLSLQAETAEALAKARAVTVVINEPGRPVQVGQLPIPPLVSVPPPTTTPPPKLYPPPPRPLPTADHQAPTSLELQNFGPWRVRFDSMIYARADTDPKGPTGLNITLQNTFTTPLKLRADGFRSALMDIGGTSRNNKDKAEYVSTPNGEWVQEITVQPGGVAEVYFLHGLPDRKAQENVALWDLAYVGQGSEPLVLTFHTPRAPRGETIPAPTPQPQPEPEPTPPPSSPNQLPTPQMRKIPGGIPGTTDRFKPFGPWRIRVDSVVYGLSSKPRSGQTNVYLTIQNTLSEPQSLTADAFVSDVLSSGTASLSELRGATITHPGGGPQTTMTVQAGAVAEILLSHDLLNRMAQANTGYLLLALKEPGQAEQSVILEMPRFAAEPPTKGPRKTDESPAPPMPDGAGQLSTPPRRPLPNADHQVGSMTPEFTDVGPWRARFDSMIYARSATDPKGPTGLNMTLQNTRSTPLKLRADEFRSTLSGPGGVSHGKDKAEYVSTPNGAWVQEMTVPPGGIAEIYFLHGLPDRKTQEGVTGWTLAYAGASGERGALNFQTPRAPGAEPARPTPTPAPMPSAQELAALSGTFTTSRQTTLTLAADSRGFNGSGRKIDSRGDVQRENFVLAPTTDGAFTGNFRDFGTGESGVVTLRFAPDKQSFTGTLDLSSNPLAPATYDGRREVKETPKPTPPPTEGVGDFQKTAFLDMKVDRIARTSDGRVEVNLTARNSGDGRKGVQYDPQRYALIDSEGQEHPSDGNYYGASAAEFLNNTVWLEAQQEAKVTFVFRNVPESVAPRRLILRERGSETAAFELAR